MKIKAFAKINLFLQILGRTPDGYHDLDMILQSVDLADTLTLEKAEGLHFALEGADIPADENNLALKAVRAFCAAAGVFAKVRLHLEKKIPAGAGLGGGSADAAAVLWGMNRLYGEPLTAEALQALAKTLGADVPFFLQGGCKRARGIGEILTPLSNHLDCVYLLVKPKENVSTAAAYGLFDETAQVQSQSQIQPCIAALESGDPEGFAAHTRNDLFAPARLLCPQMEPVLELLKKDASAAFMTGSGSALVGLYKKERLAERALDALDPSLYASAHLVRAAKTGLWAEE